MLGSLYILMAAMLVIATPDTLQVRQMAEAARTHNPGIEVVVRTHNETEAELLRRDMIGRIFLGEHELALAMLEHVVARTGEAGGEG